MASNVKTYLIYGIDKQRKPRMINEFKEHNIDPDKVQWVTFPNKDDLTEEMLEKYVAKDVTLRPGQIACTIKHYLILQDIVKNQYPIALVLEDNIAFKCDYSKKVDEYINELSSFEEGWDICFDSSLLNYIEEPINNKRQIYKKTNEITKQCHGGTRGVACYLITLECATKLYKSFLPFEKVSDFWYNHLFRLKGIRSYWVNPNNVYVAPHNSTA